MNASLNPAGSAVGWHAAAATCPSERHLEPNQVCQDAAAAILGPRPFLIVADGRGSSPFSHHGSHIASACLGRTLEVLEPLLHACLDEVPTDVAVAEANWTQIARVLIAALAQQQKETALKLEVDPTMLEFTLAAAVVGAHAIGCVRVGDSALVVERRGCDTEFALRPQGGDYANETFFVSPGAGTEIIATLRISKDGVTGLIAFTDGLSSRLIHRDSLAPGVGQIVRKVGSREWTDEGLSALIQQACWREGGHDDDRGLAVLATAVSQANDQPANSCSTG